MPRHQAGSPGEPSLGFRLTRKWYRMTDQQVAAVSERYKQALKSGDDPHDWPYAWRSELNRGGFRAVDFLMDEIVDNGKCVGCASCVTICPTDVFDYVDERPTSARVDACVQCVLCADVCPVLRPPDIGLAGALGFKQPLRDDGYGPFSYELYARASIPEVVSHTQDGGVVSTILVNELERGNIRGAILGDTDPDDPQVGRHKLARTEHDIMSCAGSRYTYSPNTLALLQAMEEDVRPVAVVGVPCQVDGVRLQQHSSIRMEMNRWYRANVPLVIGLFCSEAFTHKSLDALAERFEVNRKDIENIKPTFVIGGPMRTMFSRQQGLTRWIEIEQEKLLEAVAHIKFMIAVYSLQLQDGRWFQHEHPVWATSWGLAEVRKLCEEDGVWSAIADQCMHGLKTRGPNGQRMPAQRPTRFMTNSEATSAEFCQRCDGSHRHQPLLGGRSGPAARYPE